MSFETIDEELYYGIDPSISDDLRMLFEENFENVYDVLGSEHISSYQ